ncbi:LOW QUALITY PROTEIN: protein HOTHEAD-like [Asparagus officinalis]|uniref:LOW QUALITY PROTEIN: protein HOTHEAD-like n=1 Tax=Asparagus officinalis TaxID=4686 RepID=UPI00098E5942|nr:LOW QUALITY PROTEIN: protein HOTHEAD-like [Asparagus officinalis]
MQNATEAPPTSYYDYIIVGGGTSAVHGCPLAATLSQTSKVLLLERGGSPYNNNNITHLSGFTDSLCDTSLTSAAQQFVSQDGIKNVRARVLGGGTCLNGGFYSRASSDYIRKAGWDMRLVKESYEWIEELLVQEPELKQWQSAVRDGLVEAGVVPDNGFTYEHLTGTKIGGTIFDQGGHRRTAADLLAQAEPKQTTVFLWATVYKILFKRGQQRPIAYGVLFKDSTGQTHKAYLKNNPNNEIIISAGALGSPQLLMLSGIGPSDHLQSLGIEIVMNQTLVGKNMADNPMNAIYVPSPSPVELSLVQLAGITGFGSYIESISGYKYLICPPRGLSRSGFILEKVADPISTGYLKLVNTDPDHNPEVTFNYFQEPQDLQTCVKGLKTIVRVIQSESFSKFRYPDVTFDSLLNDTLQYLGIKKSNKLGNYKISVEQFCKDTVMTIWHYHGGCQVGQVVDHDYRVLGVDALRVLDGSTFNSSPGTNPQATLLMLGRYMAVKIQQERLNMKEHVSM